jgi:hypothetical protein
MLLVRLVYAGWLVHCFNAVLLEPSAIMTASVEITMPEAKSCNTAFVLQHLAVRNGWNT